MKKIVGGLIVIASLTTGMSAPAFASGGGIGNHWNRAEGFEDFFCRKYIRGVAYHVNLPCFLFD